MHGPGGLTLLGLLRTHFYHALVLEAIAMNSALKGPWNLDNFEGKET